MWTLRQMIAPEDNKVCYYTFKSVKEASVENPTRQALINYALQFIGNPYVWGGTDPVHGADCSGFAQHVCSSGSVFREHPLHSLSME